MRITAFAAIVLAGLALSACAPRYYYDDRYDTGYYGARHGYYSDRDRTYDPNYDRSHYYGWRDRY